MASLGYHVKCIIPRNLNITKNNINGLWDTVNDLTEKKRWFKHNYFMMMTNILPIQTTYQMHLIHTAQI